MSAYEEYGDAIFRYCFFQTRSRELALDMSQDTFTKTWEYLNRGNDIENIKAFLYRVAKNIIIDYRRKKKSSSLDELLDEGFDYEEEEDEMERQETSFEAKQAVLALDDLKDQDKEILTMRFIDSLSVKEIAQKLGMTENNISVRIHRGLQKLNDILHTNHD